MFLCVYQVRSTQNTYGLFPRKVLVYFPGCKVILFFLKTIIQIGEIFWNVGLKSIKQYFHIKALVDDFQIQILIVIC